MRYRKTELILNTIVKNHPIDKSASPERGSCKLWGFTSQIGADCLDDFMQEVVCVQSDLKILRDLAVTMMIVGRLSSIKILLLWLSKLWVLLGCSDWM